MSAHVNECQTAVFVKDVKKHLGHHNGGVHGLDGGGGLGVVRGQALRHGGQGAA